MNYSKKEEFLNTITHGIGLILAITGLVIILIFTKPNALYLISGIVFCICMILLYLASTLYHAISQDNLKKIFQKMDHLAIYLLIAGSYTPFSLVGLGGKLGWLLFGIIWSLVIFGFVYKLSFLKKYKKISLILYLSMGWLVIFFFKPLFSQLNHTQLLFLIIGGLAYTFGVIFYANQKIKFNHAIWHVFVLAGSIFHYFSIYSLLV